MTQLAKQNSSLLPGLIINWRDINYGMILISIYILIEIGSFTLFDFVRQFRLQFVIAVLTILYAVYLVIRGRFELNSPLNRIFLVFTVYAMIYSQLSTITPYSKEEFSTLILQYVANYIIIVSCIKKPHQFVFIIDVFLFAVLHSSYHSIFQGGRVWGTNWLRGENNVGLVCAYAIPFAFILYLNYKNSIKKYGYLLLIPIYITAVIVANSRGGFVTLAVVTFFCWLFVKNKFRILVMILIASMMIVKFAPDSFFVELKSLEQGAEEGTADERIYSWGLALMMFRDYPVFGVGPSNYPEYFLEYDAKVESRFGIDAPGYKRLKKRVAHSTQFQWIAEFGLVGIFLLFYFQLRLYRNWRIIYDYKLPKSADRFNDIKVLELITHANLITQIGFWMGALFISILHYPFYWYLPAFSEAWKNIYLNYVKESNDDNSVKLPPHVKPK